ncbi:MAG: Holliday junction resolvase RecU [Clostridia bacterium]|jgi:recombination protein U|nr:Holliday junction resolvase RecU [Clostridia bacterium]
MGYWNSRGLRGDLLEEIINMTNEKYIKSNIAIVQKIPTPIKPIKIDKETRHIKLAYFEKKSTVDYIGVVQGIPICFDAKETGLNSIPISNIHEHQIEFMDKFEKQGGLAFLIVFFSKYDKYKIITFEILRKFYKDAIIGGRKSIPYTAIDEKYIIENSGGKYLNYLETLNTYLTEKDDLKK